MFTYLRLGRTNRLLFRLGETPERREERRESEGLLIVIALGLALWPALLAATLRRPVARVGAVAVGLAVALAWGVGAYLIVGLPVTLACALVLESRG